MPRLLNVIFRGGFPMQGGHVYRTHFRNVHRRPQNHQNDNQNTQPSWGAMLHFLPMVFLFLFTFWGGQQESPPYSLRRETMYNQELFTKARNVPFYVHDKRVFAKQYPEQSYGRTSLEREVRRLWLFVCELFETSLIASISMEEEKNKGS